MRVRNQTQSRLVIYVRESIEKTSYEHCLAWHTPQHKFFFHELTRLQFYCCSGANKITYALS